MITQPGGPEVLRVLERPKPEPKADELLVRVRAAGLNRADLLQRAGHYPAPPGSPQDIPGMEFCGVVQAVGSAVQSRRVGERVFGIVGGGAQAEYLVAPEKAAIVVPEALSDVEGGGIPEAYITAHDALYVQAALNVGERVLVHAVGSGVGIAALQLAKARGCVVFGTARSPEKLERAEALGLDTGIDVKNMAFDEVARDVNVIIDFVGGPYFEKNINALAVRGRLVIVSTLGGQSASLPLRTLMSKRLRIMGTMLRSRSNDEKGEATQAFAQDVIPLFANRSIRVPIDRVFKLEEAPAAHRYMEENRNFGKIVLAI